MHGVVKGFYVLKCGGVGGKLYDKIPGLVLSMSWVWELLHHAKCQQYDEVLVG